MIFTFLADSENKTPLLPMIPTGYPNILENPKQIHIESGTVRVVYNFLGGRNGKKCYFTYL